MNPIFSSALTILGMVTFLSGGVIAIFAGVSVIRAAFEDGISPENVFAVFGIFFCAVGGFMLIGAVMIICSFFGMRVLA